MDGDDAAGGIDDGGAQVVNDVDRAGGVVLDASAPLAEVTASLVRLVDGLLAKDRA